MASENYHKGSSWRLVLTEHIAPAPYNILGKWKVVIGVLLIGDIVNILSGLLSPALINSHCMVQ